MGKNEIRAETNQMTTIVKGTDFRVNHSVYCRGSLIWIYLKATKKTSNQMHLKKSLHNSHFNFKTCQT